MEFFYRLKRMGKIATYIILSLGLSLAVLNTSLAVYGKAKGGVVTFQKMFDLKNTYIFSMETNDPNFEDFNALTYDIENILNKSETLKNDGLIYKTLKYGWNPFLGRDIVESKLPIKYKDTMGDYHYNINMTLDFEFIKKNPIEVFKGRTFEKADFEVNPKEQRIPIIVGSNFQAMIGEQIISKDFISINVNGKIEEVPLVYEVIGVYKPNTVPGIIKSFTDKKSLKTYYEDTFILFPEIKGSYPLDYSVPANVFGVYMELTEGTDPETVKLALENLSETKKIAIEYTSISDGSLTALTAGFLDGKSTLALGLILVALSTIGAINIMLGHIMKRRKEIGVKLAIGANFNDIFREFFKDMFSVTLVAALVSVFLVFMINKQPVDNKIILLNIAFAAVIAFVITLLPVRKLTKIDSVELMRGSK